MEVQNLPLGCANAKQDVADTTHLRHNILQREILSHRKPCRKFLTKIIIGTVRIDRMVDTANNSVA